MVVMAGEKKTKTEKVAKKVPSKSASRASSKTASKTSSKTTGKASGKTTGKTSSKTTGKALVKTASKAHGKTTSKALVKTPSKAQIKAPVKAASKEKAPQFSMSKAEWDAFIEKMENLLQEEKSEIINTLIANNNDFKEIVDGMDPKDFADIASDDIDRKMIEMLGSQELKRLKLIESAQTRIKQGKYGHCIKCDRPIPPERLEAIPYALMCIECKSEEERRNR
jgi:RNA polymerase-binding transcription factor DksA